MTISKGNWGFKDPGDDIPADSVIEGGQFMQLLPDTPIIVGKPLVIRGGNFTNVRRDPQWPGTSGLWVQLDFCSHLHEYPGLAECAEDCRHVVNTEEVVVDGVGVIDTVYTYEDTRV